MALTISTGFVVDDAIVMIENIVRYLEQGESPLNAALKGAKQIGFTVVSLSVSLIAVFIPLLFMTGIVGRLFREFAITLSVAVIVSAVVSLTLTPMMCAKLLGKETSHEPEGRDKRHAGLMGWFEWAFDRVAGLVRTHAALGDAAPEDHALRRRGHAGGDDSPLRRHPEGAAAAAGHGADHRRDRRGAEYFLQGDGGAPAPRVRRGAQGSGRAGGRGVRGRRHGQPDRQQRPALHRAQAARTSGGPGSTRSCSACAKATRDIEGISLFLQPAQDLQIDTRISRTQYQYVMQSVDSAELATWAPKLLEKLKTVTALQDVASDQQSNGLQLNIDIDREKASRLNILTQAIDDTLYDAFGQRQVSVIYTQLNQFRVILEVPPGFRDSPDALDKIYVKAGITTTAATGGSGVSGSSTTCRRSRPPPVRWFR